MSYYDYKVVAAPKYARRVKGVRGPAELFAMTLAETINEVARQGWEYLRAETMAAESPRGWFRRAVATEHTVLIFRRPRENLSPRLTGAPVDEGNVEDAPEPLVPERTRPEPLRRVGGRSEPAVGDSTEVPATLRAAPRIGADEEG
jgi:hypothetical protein